MTRFFSGISERLSLHRLAAAAILLLVLSLCPILWISFYGYASGDDLGYGFYVKHVLEEGGTLLQVLASVCGEIRNARSSWQGTWSSIFLFCFEPSVFGERFYTLVPWIAVFFFLAGTGAFLHTALVRHAGMGKDAFAVLFSALAVFSLQYLPYMRGGIFWYTSAVHYTVPYGVALLCLSAAYGCLYKDRKMVPLCIGAAYLGGAGYPPIVLLAEGLFFLILYGLYKASHGMAEMRTRALRLLLPLALLLTGFAVSATAPGNRVRGGSGFGLNAGSLLKTLTGSAAEGITGSLCEFRRVPVLFFLVIVIVFVTVRDAENSESDRRTGPMQPAVATVLCYLCTAGVYAPGIFAGTSVSGGLPDTVWFVFLLMLTVWLASVTRWLVARGDLKGRLPAAVRVPVVCVSLAVCLLFAGRVTAGSVDAVCVRFAASGELADYSAQMKERIALLTDTSAEDVTVPEMNDQQGPFMCMPLVRDTENFVNKSTAAFYGKNSVTAVPRDEYEKQNHS